MLMTAVFLVATAFIVYTYALFPLLLHYRAKQTPTLEPSEPDSWPTVSIVIAAYNEAKNLPVKLASLEKLDYPENLVEWIIVSDGSTDETESLLNESFDGHPQRKVKQLKESLGKCGALNEGVALATGEIIVFMDARQAVSSNALKKLVPYLGDSNIGAVSGELVLSDDTSLEAGNYGLYWRYEKWIRDNESRLFSTTGATGALYAIRRSEFTPNPVGTLLDDFDTPVGLLKQGKRTIFVSGALAFDKASDDMDQEFRRKVRNLTGNWQSFQTHRWLFNRKQNKVWWQFLSHKVFRLLVPQALILAFVSSWLGSGFFLDTMFYLQLAFYLIAAASFAGLPGTSNKLFNFIKVFLQLNTAALVATVRFFLDSRAVSWR